MPSEEVSGEWEELISLKGWNTKAQGNALGRNATNESPERQRREGF